MIIAYAIAWLFGLVFGNFGTVLYYRIPRNISLCGMRHRLNSLPPFCSECKEPLRWYEYLAPLHWFFVRGKCNYCGVKIDPSYSIIEIVCSIIAVILCLIFGMTYSFIAFEVAAVLTVVQVAILVKHKLVYCQIVLMIFFALYIGNYLLE